MITHGPYGGRGLQNWSIESGQGGRIKKVMIKHGFIVDGIGFEIVDAFNKSFVTWFSGPGGGTAEINLDPEEYISQISGTHGLYHNITSMTIITSLKIHTNVRPQGYGPFGSSRAVSRNEPFASTLLSDHAIVRFSGIVGEHLISINAFSAPLLFGIHRS
ncbi:hypothetical protein RND81_10G093500 [Saponaria officinalis]|uniref:Jacalin-type lectin domain-containing protein n=1 Tax=Saponaria officinalis TaxID=3572 RepID=A0AAW1I045_SAPOF